MVIGAGQAITGPGFDGPLTLAVSVQAAPSPSATTSFKQRLAKSSPLLFESDPDLSAKQSRVVRGWIDIGRSEACR